MRTIFTLSLFTMLALAGVADAVELISPSEVGPGSQGVCLTEMDGGEMVEIPLEVIGTAGPSAPEREIVLVRLLDPRFEHTGIIAGMSGSPVYIDGRLLGALAFGWSFAKEPIGGVTPFGRMQQLAAEPAAPGGGRTARPAFDELIEAAEAGELGSLLVDWLLPEPAGEYRQLPLAVSMGGLWTPTGEGWLAESWRRLGWVSTPAAASTGATAGGDLRPGDMVAGVLVDGDATLGAGGTVTEVRGDQVWAFGHPFLGGGSARMPMARAQVVSVLPSQAVSFKFFKLGEQIGAFEADRSHGVWGRLGSEAPMVPVTVTVDGRSYSFRAIRHPVLLPLITGYLTNASYAARGRTFGDQTISMRVELDYQGGRRAVLEEIYAGGDAPMQAAGLATAAVAYLENSSFEAPEPEAVRIELSSSESLETAVVVEAVPERRVVRPGETLLVRLRIRPHRGEDYMRAVELRVPRGTPEGQLDLVVADGAAWTVYDLQMRPSRPASFEHELALFDRLVPSRKVVLALEIKDVGIAMAGGSLSVPPSVAVQLRSGLGPNLQTTTHSVIRRVEEELPTAVSAALRIPLKVRAEEAR